ncbi:glutaredoxin [Labedella gwakjiensis]|uniref:Glutaredoxin n=1 Tax=Labedella gwakjiensis TaxID=390269 RepID=A0A2P8H0B8_9MICO|nr:thioredoxin family protein [Labedella gwakjiensis]PSL39674.1 glutaredoxin [Labedella gwakjiensis]RUQ85938.1 thioredoxin [Labedella gwakjiensis]
MEPLAALSITAAVLAVAAAIAIVLRSTTGRARPGDDSSFAPGQLPGLDVLGRTATLVQFSTEFCSSCPATRRLLQRITSDREELTYLDVDLTHDAELASRLRILQTPTVFVLDRRGRLVSRIGGSPRLDALTDVLDGLSSIPVR